MKIPTFVTVDGEKIALKAYMQRFDPHPGVSPELFFQRIKVRPWCPAAAAQTPPLATFNRWLAGQILDEALTLLAAERGQA